MINTLKNTPQQFHVLVKPAGAKCNLNCAYCYYLSKEELYSGSNHVMSNELLETFTRQYIAAQCFLELTFSWQGGEPTLMGLDFFQRALALQQKYRRPGIHIMNALQTNGTLLDNKWCHFFQVNEFLVGVSLDGPRIMHDAFRTNKGGKPTFKRVIKAVSLLRKHKVQFNILACVHAANSAYPLEVYHFLRDQVGASFIQFIPIVQPNHHTEGTVTDHSVGARQYGEFLITIFDEWVHHDVGRVYVQIFDVALAAWLGRPSGLCTFDRTCGTGLVLEHNGDLYSCDHFVDPQHKLGNILEVPIAEMIRSSQQRQFGLAKYDTLPQRCLSCNVRFVCNGGCPKNRIIYTPDGEPGHNYLCEGYLAFFRHIDKPMRFMAAELLAGRPPANIMRYLTKHRTLPTFFKLPTDP